LSNSASPVRVGIIGTGHGARVLAPAFRLDSRCQVVAMAASSQDRADQSAAAIGLTRGFGDWRELVRSPEVDLVAVAVPPLHQPEMVIEALGIGKPVFCEKPLGSTVQSAMEMASAASKSGTPNIVDFLFPEIPTWARAKKILSEGGVGDLRHVYVEWSVETYANRENLDSWKTRSEEGGGALNNFCSHCFHYLEWFLGPGSKVSANLIQAPNDHRSGETIAAMAVEFLSGVSATVSVNTAAPLVHQHRLMFHGDDGTLVLSNSTPNYANCFQLLHGTRKSGVLDNVLTSDDPGLEGNPQEDGRIAAAFALVSRLLDWMETGVPEAL